MHLKFGDWFSIIFNLLIKAKFDDDFSIVELNKAFGSKY